MGSGTTSHAGLRAGSAIALAFVLDTAIAEPPQRIHPVALFGRLVAPIDREWRFPRFVGALASGCLPTIGAGIAAGTVLAADRLAASVSISPLLPGDADRSLPLDVLAAGGVLFVTTSRRMLIDTAREVVADTDTDAGLPRARRDLRALAGRDSATLPAGRIRSAAVESAGENFADGLLAPLLAFSLFAPRSLPAAAGAAAWVKAVNTMDSMLGYRSVPTGFAPARLDDAVMWVPARLSALVLALAAADLSALGVARRWAGEPSSPNSGWPMATLAVCCGVRLEKPGVYTLNPAAQLPTTAEANAGIDLASRAGVLSVLVAFVAVVLAGESIIEFASRWIEWS